MVGTRMLVAIIIAAVLSVACWMYCEIQSTPQTVGMTESQNARMIDKAVRDTDYDLGRH